MNKLLVTLATKMKKFLSVLSGPLHRERPLQRLSLKYQMLILKQLSILSNSGVPLFVSLTLVAEQSTSLRTKAFLRQITKDVENGQSLSGAIGKHKKAFDPLVKHMISVGESSGTFARNLEQAIALLRKKQVLKQKLWSASLYPLVLVAATLGMIAILVFLVFPRIVPVFSSIHYRLPWPTRLLIFINSAVESYGLVGLFSAILLFIGLLFIFRTENMRTRLHEAAFHVPFIRKLIQIHYATNICRTVGTLLNNQTKVLRAFEVTAETTSNPVYRRELRELLKRLEQGESISSHLRETPLLFPRGMAEVIRMAESTGTLHETFLYLSGVFEEEMDDLIKNLASLVEPLLLVCMGILVGFVALSIITPMYGITQHLNA